MADKDIIIGRAINVTGMIGVSAAIVLLAFGLYWSYFGVALASILETSFTGFGRPTSGGKAGESRCPT
jgi:hypothetical protein